jgi:hypothetical protein
MQSLPSIRLVQENDKSLVTKINSTLVNTVPLWETQLAQAVTIQRSTEAAKAVKEATDLTNELLTANAENLRESNAWSARRWSAACSTSRREGRQCRADRHDRGSLQIADEGKARRAAAEVRLPVRPVHRRHPLDRRHPRHDGLAVRARGPRDQVRRQADGARGAGGGLRPRGPAGRCLHPRSLHARDQQHADHDDAAALGPRLQIALQVRDLLRQHQPVHRPEMGHEEPDHAARSRSSGRPASAPSAPTRSRSPTRAAS